MAPLILLLSGAVTGCLASGPVARTGVPAPSLTPTHPATATPTLSNTALPSATPTSTPTPTSSPTPIAFQGTALAPLDSLASVGPFEGELALLAEIVLPPASRYFPAFVPGTSQLIYKYGLSLRRLDLTTNQLAGELVPPIAASLSMYRIAPDGDYVAIGDGGDLVVIDLVTEEVIRRIEVTNTYILGMAIARSGDFLLTMDDSGELVVWDTVTWEAHGRFQHPSDDINDRLYSNPSLLPDQNLIALEGAPGQVYLYGLDGDRLGEVYIGGRDEMPLIGEPGGRLVLEQDRAFMVFDPDGSPIGGVRLITYDCHDTDTYAIQLLILDAQGEQLGCQYLLDHDRYWLTDEQGATVATVDTEARRITFTWADGTPLGKVRLGFPEYGGTLVEVLGLHDETVGRTYLDDGKFLTVLPNGGAVGAITGRNFLCVDLDTGQASCSMPIDDLGRYFDTRTASIPDGYWLAQDTDLRLRLFDFVNGREAFISQAMQDIEIKSVALSDDRAFLALLVDKPGTTNAFLQIWGYSRR